MFKSPLMQLKDREEPTYDLTIYRWCLLRAYLPFQISFQEISKLILNKSFPGGIGKFKGHFKERIESGNTEAEIIKFQRDWFVKLRFEYGTVETEATEYHAWSATLPYGPFLRTVSAFKGQKFHEQKIFNMSFEVAPPLGAMVYGANLPETLAPGVTLKDAGYIPVYLDLTSGKESLDIARKQILAHLGIDKVKLKKMAQKQNRELLKMPAANFSPLEEDLEIVIKFSREGRPIADIEESLNPNSEDVKGEAVEKRLKTLRPIIDPRGLTDSWYDAFKNEKTTSGRRAKAFRSAADLLKSYAQKRYGIVKIVD